MSPRLGWKHFHVPSVFTTVYKTLVIDLNFASYRMKMHQNISMEKFKIHPLDTLEVSSSLK